jgi:Domain of unknown function (DUF427)
MGAQTPVNSRGKPGIAEHHLGTRTRTFAGDIRREREPCALLAMQKVVGSNPISRLKKAAICRSISTRQPASASASPCTQCAPARLDVPVGAEKEGICRSLADARTTDLLHRGGQQGHRHPAHVARAQRALGGRGGRRVAPPSRALRVGLRPPLVRAARGHRRGRARASFTADFCPYKGLCSYYDIGDADRAAWSYLEAYDQVGQINEMVSFEPDKVTVLIDGVVQHLAPGQQVVPHGIDRGFGPEEAEERKQAA